MRLLIHSDALFLVEWYGKSNYGGFFYLGWNQSDEEEQKINCAIEVSASILPVAISVAKAEMGGSFYKGKKVKVFRLTLDEMGFKQGPTTIFVDNNTAIRICNNTIKRPRSWLMNGQFFWLIDQVNLNIYRIVSEPGLENLADYFTKTIMAAKHRAVSPYYVQILLSSSDRKRQVV